MSGNRLTYRFGPLERRGILGPVRAGQAASLASGALLAIGSLNASPNATGALLALLLFGLFVALAVVPVRERTLEEWAPVACAFVLRRVGGGRRWSSGAPGHGLRWRLGPRSQALGEPRQLSEPDQHPPPPLRGVKITEIGCSSVTTTMAVVTPACMRLPTSTWRMPTRPATGDVIRQ